MKIAICQTNIYWEDKEKNFQVLEKNVQDAKKQDARLVLFPEMSLTGFSMNIAVTMEEKNETIERIKRIAQELDIAIGIGWVKKHGDKAENHYTVIDHSGNELSDYIKIHPFSYAGENEKFVSGNEIVKFVIDGICFSTFICYDLRFPEIFQIASKEAHVLIIPANWPAKRRGHWLKLLMARAIENQSYVLGINCFGLIGGLEYSGDSCVIGCDGEIKNILSNTEGQIVFDIRDDVQDLRNDMPIKFDRKDNYNVYDI